MIYIAADSSQIVMFRRCEYLWKLSQKECLQRKGTKRTAMDQGTLFHALLEHYYNHLFYHPGDFDAARNYALDKVNSLALVPQGLTKEDICAVKERFKWYVLAYSEGDFKIANMLDGSPAIELGFSIDLVKNEHFHFVLEGRIDAICLFGPQDQKFFVDHKTQGRKQDIYHRSIQFMNYALATNLSRGMINYIGMSDKVNDNTFRRELMYFSPPVLSRWKDSLITTFYQMANADLMNFYEQRWESCPGFYGRPCDMTRICENTDPHIVKEIKRIEYEVKEEWTPWREQE